jgi:hypothetical protein
MNGQLELNAEQVIRAIKQLDPDEKVKVQQELPRLFDLPEYLVGPDRKPAAPVSEEKPIYQFAEVRHLLREVKGSLSEEVVADREDRF